LPPRFQEGVWRRIEQVEATTGNERRESWLDAIVFKVLRPRFAMATAIVLVLAGSFVGVREGRQMARQDAQARYLAAVAPNSLR
jgi:hypothetical protein